MKGNEETKEPIILNRATLVPVSVALLISAFAIHFTSVKTLAESNKAAIKANEVRTDKAIDFTNESRRRIFDRLHVLEIAVGRVEGKLDLLIKEKK